VRKKKRAGEWGKTKNAEVADCSPMGQTPGYEWKKLRSNALACAS